MKKALDQAQQAGRARSPGSHRGAAVTVGVTVRVAISAAPGDAAG